MSAKKVIYVGPYSFPNGGAAARRILGNALSLRQAGYEVVLTTGQLSGAESLPTGEREYQGFKVFSLGERTAESYPRLLKHLLYFNMGVKTIAWLESLKQKPHAVILYSGYSPYMMRLIPWCKKNRVKFIFDAVEWYEPKSYLSGLLSPYQWNIELAMRYYSKKTHHVIAISSYLQKHYASKGAQCVRIPPTLDVGQLSPNLSVNYNTELVVSYTGIPGNKDLFNEYLEAVLYLQEQGEKIRFKFAGIESRDLMKYPAIIQRGFIKQLPDFLECYGLVSFNQAMNITRSSDFSILLRRSERYAQAGFPTKVVESLALGTPVIINLTSDLGKYVQDKVQGLICDEPTTESLINVLSKALRLSVEQKLKMRVQSREQAKKSFDCYKFSHIMQKIIG